MNGRCQTIIEAVRAILEHGNTAEIKRRKNGEIIVLEVRRKVKKKRGAVNGLH